MSKPISTALDVDGLFRADEVAPEHGGKASQGPIPMRSGTSASAARPSRPANVNTPTASYPDSITVDVGNGDFAYSLGNNVAQEGTVVLQSSGGSYNVRTEMAGTPTDVFKEGSSPYPANGTNYHLRAGITGTITLVNLNASVAASRAIARQSHDHDRGHDRGHGHGHGHGGGGYGDAGGKNGNINVGG